MKKKPIASLLLLFSLLHCPLLADEAAKPAAMMLREALFAEQADRDLAKAEKGYREIIKSFETDRTYAATAILRLAEILHERGDKLEAEKWFARILQEFPDQKEISNVAIARLGDKAGDLLGARPARINPQTEEIERLTTLLNQSPDLLNSSRDGSTLLATAASKGQLEVVEFLLSKGARFDSIGQSVSPLAIAVNNGHVGVFARLLKAGAKPEPGILNNAVLAGNYAITERLLKAGADPNGAHPLRLDPKEIKEASLFPPETDESTGEIDDPFANERLVNRKPENVFESHPEVLWTPLEIATFYRFTKLTDLLLAKGAKPQKLHGQFTEELRFAIVDQNAKLVAKLLKHGADPKSIWQHDQGKMSALSIASFLGNAEIVKQLLQAGAEVNGVDSKGGYTPLNYANGPTVKVLLDAGADPNVKPKSGLTPLHNTTDPAKAKLLLEAGAVLYGEPETFSPIVRANLEVLDVLLATKPDLTRMEGPHTALGHAAARARGETQVKRIEKLIAAGADPNQVDENGMTPLLIAVSSFSVDGVKALIEGGADPNGVPNTKSPLIHLTSINVPRRGLFGPMVRALVEAGANPDDLSPNSDTILRRAARDNDLETVRYLLKKGASLQLGDKFAFTEARNQSTTKAELFLATYLQPKRRRGIIRVVSSKTGHIYNEVSAINPDGEKLPECPYSLLEAYAFAGEIFVLGKATIWREGKAEPLTFDLRNIVASGDPARDVKLVWGDVVEFERTNTVRGGLADQAEKEFLTTYLNRQVTLAFEGETKKVRLELRWEKSSGSDQWMRIRNSREQVKYTGDLRSSPFLSLKNLRFELPIEAGPSGYILDIQAVERNGQRIKIPREEKLTPWIEPGDIIHLRNTGTEIRRRYVPNQNTTK